MPSSTVMNKEELFRSINFAPIALLVLDGSRKISMLNALAESILEVDGNACIGRGLELYLSPSSRKSFSSALDETLDLFSKSSKKTIRPITTRLEVNSAHNQDSDWVDLSISAWSHEEGTIGDSASTDKLLRPLHTCFTISIIPSTPKTSETKTKTERSNLMSKIMMEYVIQHMDFAIMAFSPQGKVIGRNKASDEVWSFLREPESGPDAALGKRDLNEDEFDLNWVQDLAYIKDETFERELSEQDWPIYKSAIKGEVAPPMFMGVVSKLNGERFIIEILGQPIRDDDGRHLGGVLSFRNVTAERQKIRSQAEIEGDVYFKRTCNAMPQMVFVTSSTGGNEWYSDSWYEYSGASRSVLDTAGWIQFVHPDDVPHALERWGVARETGDLFSAPLRIKRHDGVYRWYQGSALPVYNHDGKLSRWFGTCTDIHDHVEALSASKRAQDQLESVIKHADVTLWAVDQKGIITIAKGPGFRLLQQTSKATTATVEKEEGDIDDAQVQSGLRDEKGTDSSSSNYSQFNRHIIGKSIYDLWDLANIRVSISKALDGETIVEESEINGRWFRTSYTPMRALVDKPQSFVGGDHHLHGEKDVEVGAGEIIGVVGASMDITDRKRTQAEMEKSLLEKTDALAAEGAAREASRLKSEFLANMSHEIRTPIAGVIGLSELILDEQNLTNQLRDYAETIQRSAEGLLVVINDVLDFSKVEIGKLEVEKVPFNLTGLVGDAKRLLAFATQKKVIEFQESLRLQYKGLLLGDAGRLKQVITNLLTNAIKFTSRGYIRLEVTEVSEDEEELKVRFDVWDTGCGIKSESLTRLFQPFSQADSSTARRYGGTGLGLSISKNLVELMSGKIALESVEGQGSHAWFYIPFQKAKGSFAGAAAVEEVEEVGTSKTITEQNDSTDALRQSSLNNNTKTSYDKRNALASQPRDNIWILIAEDNAVNARIALKNVERMGFNCRVAENGLVALKELDMKRYDLVLMDCQMPLVDGYEATTMIRKSKDPTIRMLPVIALTASAIKGDRERALEAGMVDYLSKPVKRSALEETLCKWLFDDEVRRGLEAFSIDESTLSPAVRRGNGDGNEEGNGTDKPEASNQKRKAEVTFEGFQGVNNNNDFLGAAATLLSARRGSTDANATMFSMSRYKLERPTVSSRSKSYH